MKKKKLSLPFVFYYFISSPPIYSFMCLDLYYKELDAPNMEYSPKYIMLLVKEKYNLVSEITYGVYLNSVYVKKKILIKISRISLNKGR